jgi:hypothetical protein
MLLFALTIRQLSKPFRLLKHPHWYNSAKRHWMTFQPSILWVVLGPWTSGLQGNETANKLAWDRTIHHPVGPETALGVSRENIRIKIKCWIDNQHMVMWGNLNSIQRQAQKMILGPSPTLKTRLLSFNRTQFRVVTGVLTGHNTLKRHLHLMGLSCSSVCTRCGAEEKTSIHVFCECDTLVFHSDAYLGSFFLDPEDVKSIGLGLSGTLA